MLWRHHYVSCNLWEVSTYSNAQSRQLSNCAGVQSCFNLCGCKDKSRTKHAILSSIRLYTYIPILYHFCYKHCKFGKFQCGLKGKSRDCFTWNFHSNFVLIDLTNIPNFDEICVPEATEISIRKSGFLQITEKTYSGRWQAPSRDAFLVKYEDCNYEDWFHWTNPRALRALGTPGSFEGPSGLRARSSPGALASALILTITKCRNAE